MTPRAFNVVLVARIALPDIKFLRALSATRARLKFHFFLLKLLFDFGAGGGIRTRTVSLPADFKSAASTCSATPAY